MKTRIIVGVALLIAVLGVGTYTSRAAVVSNGRHWTTISFMEPVMVKNQFIMGSVLIVHDDEKMARGEPCTTFYRFEPGRGPKEELVSFHCRPIHRDAAAQTVLKVVGGPDGCKRLTEYQIAGDAEAQGVPLK